MSQKFNETLFWRCWRCHLGAFKETGLSIGHDEVGEWPVDLIEAFKVFDKNRDGCISSEELQRTLRSPGFGKGRDLGTCEKMICKFDLKPKRLLDFCGFKTVMKNKD